MSNLLRGQGGGGKSRIPEVVTVIPNYFGTCVKAYDNKTALLKSVLKTVMDPPWWP